MHAQKHDPDRFQALRQQAEALIQHRSNLDTDLPTDILELIQELKIHQIELEMQNEELRQAQLALEESRIRSTIFSPNRVGQVLTRKSIALFLEMRILIRPSWGIRRSAVSIRDITLTRAESLPPIATGAHPRPTG